MSLSCLVMQTFCQCSFDSGHRIITNHLEHQNKRIFFSCNLFYFLMVICIAHQRNTIIFVFAKNDVRWTIILTKTKWSLSTISPYPLAEMDRGSKSRGGGAGSKSARSAKSFLGSRLRIRLSTGVNQNMHNIFELSKYISTKRLILGANRPNGLDTNRLNLLGRKRPLNVQVPE